MDLSIPKGIFLKKYLGFSKSVAEPLRKKQNIGIRDLRDLLRKNPANYLPLFETAAAEVLACLRSRVSGESGEMEEPETEEVQIFLTSKEDPVSMRLLGAQYISKLVKISRITIAA
ncbi:hypothetical protein ACET3Z_018698 [Daucus carota]